MATPLNCDDFFTQNTDISGIGVRIAFYLQVYLLIVQVALSPEEAANAFWTLTSMSLGLVVAAIVSAVQGSLSFYNANIVQNLALLANMSLFSILAGRGLALRKRLRRLQRQLLTGMFIIESLLAYSLVIYLWATAYRFGPDAECTPSLKFYILFWRASLSFKTIRILALVSNVGGALYILRFVVYYRMSLVEADELSAIAESESRKGNAAKVATWTLVFVVWVYLGIGVLWIAPIEKFLQQHPQQVDADSQWAFGQILALIAVMPSMVSVLFALQEAFSEPKERPQRDEESKVAVAEEAVEAAEP